MARMRIVTVEDLENALGKPFVEFTEDEKDLVAKRYSVVPSTTSPEFEAAHKLKARARQDIIKLCFRAIFLIFFILQLDNKLNVNWWLIFTPFWVMSFCICCGSFQTFAEAQAAISERDAVAVGSKENNNDDNPSSLDLGATDENGNSNSATKNGNESKHEHLSEEERNELKGQVIQAGSKFVTSCFSQAFIVLIVCMFVGKLQGADYSAMWIISPLLLIASLVLCLLGCTIFCITSAEDDEREFDTQSSYTKQQSYSDIKKKSNYLPPNQNRRTYDETSGTNEKLPPKSTWDPEKGEMWQGGYDPNDVELTPQNMSNTPDANIDQHQPVRTADLLDIKLSPSEERNTSIEPTASEVEDLD